MQLYRNIDYSKQVFETLRNYLSVNKSGLLSYLFKYFICCFYPLQLIFDDYVVWRTKKNIIANCKFQVGQLTNVLNYLYDNTQNRIYINQNQNAFTLIPTILEESNTFIPLISEESNLLLPTIDNVYNTLAQVVINVPSDIYNNATIMSDFVSTIEQIRVLGLTYIINEI